MDEVIKWNKSDVPILIVEDSPLLIHLIIQSLRNAGYRNLITKNNGRQAYDVIQEAKLSDTLDENVKWMVTT